MNFLKSELDLHKDTIDEFKNNIQDSIIKRIFELGYETALKKTQNKFNVQHKTTKLKHNSGILVDIDKNISKLIKLLWKLKINTCNSCEDNVPADYMWIQFQTNNDFEKFMNLLFESNNDELYKDVMYTDHWIISTNTFDVEDPTGYVDFDECESVSSYEPHIITEVSLRFPKHQYNDICERLEKHVNKKSQSKHKIEK